MDETERRLKISLRMKAARYLAGERSTGKKREAVQIPNRDLVELGPLQDEKVTFNQLTEVEQMRATLTRTEMEAYIRALKLPDDWFDGLYPSDRGEVSTAFGALLRGVEEVARELRQAREAAGPSLGASDPPGAAGGGAGG